MNRRVLRTCTTAGMILAAATAAEPLRAQAWSYPSFQPPRITAREFNFGVADAGDAGTSLVFQWREGITPRAQLSLDVGVADPDGGGDSFLLLGGGMAAMLSEARADLPLDFLLTAGLNLAIGGDGNLLRLPVGVSLGHRFPLEQGMAITPYVHPRVSIDYCGDCGIGDNSRTELGVDFDIGASFDVNPSLTFRLSALFGGSDLVGNSDGFGLSLAWRPAGLSPGR